MHRPAIRIKICGLTRVDEACACIEAGADFIGLNFHRPSPRFVDEPRAGEIVAALSKKDQAIGVFVDQPPGAVASLADRVGLVAVQLHGNEPPADLVALDRFWIIKAFRLGTDRDVEQLKHYLAECSRLGRSPDAVLVDAFVPGQEGGTGILLGDDLLSSLPHLERLILAGGLSPRTVAARLERILPWMVDTASGVESSPGRKDPDKVRAFIEAVRSSRIG